ncbi:glutamine amidotransferase [Nocardioides speluncae]|uniref:glutamine amidotransferase n=1 Tax=Nocardioides speluncae TaxID=2670337 RepID=UPI000D68BE52|nr:glutamine amidotransferase [Nocardioides speluncae]
MKPFLLLATRAEDEAADNEYDAILAYAGLDESRLRRHRLERDPLGHVDLDHWAGIIVGGGPFNVSDPAESKGAVQVRVEAETQALLDEVVARDFPFFGACYGIGALGVRDGGAVDRTYGEPVGAVKIELTDEGRADPLFGVLPDYFDAFLGHKEGISRMPRSAVVLASSATCPVQALRFGNNVYATQFHPELDSDGLCTRVDVYQHYGYFDPSEAEGLKAMAAAATVTEPERLLEGFVGLFG